MIIFIDVDGTVADTIPAAIEDANKHLHDRNCIHIEDITDHEIARCAGLDAYQKEELVYALGGRGGLCYSDVRPIPGALKGVKALREMGHRIVFVTAGHPDRITEKRSWLERHGFLLKDSWNFDPETTKLLWCCDKGLLKGDALIDDSPVQLGRFLESNPDEHGFLIPQPWSAHDSEVSAETTWDWLVKFFQSEPNYDNDPDYNMQRQEAVYERSVEAWSREE